MTNLKTYTPDEINNILREASLAADEVQEARRKLREKYGACPKDKDGIILWLSRHDSLVSIDLQTLLQKDVDTFYKYPWIYLYFVFPDDIYFNLNF